MNYKIAFLGAFLYFLIGCLFLWLGFPAEDAFILFKYVKEFGSGNGIVFFSGGLPAEGATDFLWMVALSALYAAGIDPAIGALVVSAACAGIAVGLISKCLILFAGKRDWLLGLAPLSILFLPSANAGYVGFSVQLFSTVALVLLFQFLSAAPAQVCRVPFTALLLGLIRPDGVVIGGVFVLLGLRAAIASGATRSFLRNTLMVVLIGAGYYLWRYQYFGLPLPLPLYVKGHTESLLPTLQITVRWLLVNYSRYLVLILALWYLSPSDARVNRLIVGLVPFGIHLLALSFSDQSQNVAYRFQGPAALALFSAALVLFSSHASLLALPWKRVMATLVIATLLIPDFANTLDLAKDARRFEYINQFAYDLGKTLPKARSLAITEAGRLGYWSKSKVYDIVGLNNPITARMPPTVEYLEDLNADIIMLHHAGTLNVAGLSSDRNIIELSSEQGLSSLVEREFVELFKRCDPMEYTRRSSGNVIVAAVCAARFLETHRAQYQIFAVSYQGSFDHIYGIKRSLPEYNEVVSKLRQSFDPSISNSYFQLNSQSSQP